MDSKKIISYKNWDLPTIAHTYGFQLSPVGGKLRGLCLFHGDRGNPNFFVYPDTDTWFCYACKRGHTKSQFIAYAERVPRRVIDNLWEKSTCLTEVMDLRLRQREINYRDSLLLLLASFCYNKRSVNTLPYTKTLREIDVEISTKSFVDFNTYTRLVKRIEEMK